VVGTTAAAFCPPSALFSSRFFALSTNCSLVFENAPPGSFRAVLKVSPSFFFSLMFRNYPRFVFKFALPVTVRDRPPNPMVSFEESVFKFGYSLLVVAFFGFFPAVVSAGQPGRRPGLSISWGLWNNGFPPGLWPGLLFFLTLTLVFRSGALFFRLTESCSRDFCVLGTWPLPTTLSPSHILLTFLVLRLSCENPLFCASSLFSSRGFRGSGSGLNPPRSTVSLAFFVRHPPIPWLAADYSL